MFLSYHLISRRIILFVKTLEKHKQEGYRLLEKHTVIVVFICLRPFLVDLSSSILSFRFHFFSLSFFFGPTAGLT